MPPSNSRFCVGLVTRGRGDRDPVYPIRRRRYADARTSGVCGPERSVLRWQSSRPRPRCSGIVLVASLGLGIWVQATHWAGRRRIPTKQKTFLCLPAVLDTFLISTRLPALLLLGKVIDPIPATTEPIAAGARRNIPVRSVAGVLQQSPTIPVSPVRGLVVDHCHRAERAGGWAWARASPDVRFRLLGGPPKWQAGLPKPGGMA